MNDSLNYKRWRGLSWVHSCHYYQDIFQLFIFRVHPCSACLFIARRFHYLLPLFFGLANFLLGLCNVFLDAAFKIITILSLIFHCVKLLLLAMRVLNMKVSHWPFYFLCWLFLYDFAQLIHTYWLWCFHVNWWIPDLKHIHFVFKCGVAELHPFGFCFVLSGVCYYRLKLRKSVRVGVSKVNPFIFLLESILPPKWEESSIGLPIDLNAIGGVVDVGTCSVPC